MAAVNNGGGFFGGLGEAQLPMQAWLESLPICTCFWILGITATSVLVQCRLLSPFQLFFSLNAVAEKRQYWRLITSFFYFGPLNFDLFFHVYFVQRYCRLLEESPGISFAKFTWMLLLSAISLLVMAPYFNLIYLGIPLSNVLVYVWGRNNPNSVLSILGLFSIRAPYTPWAFLGFNWIVTGSLPSDDLAGVIVGHAWYFFNEIFPLYFHGARPLDPPRWWLMATDAFTERLNIEPNPEPIENELRFWDEDGGQENRADPPAPEPRDGVAAPGDGDGDIAAPDPTMFGSNQGSDASTTGGAETPAAPSTASRTNNDIEGDDNRNDREPETARSSEPSDAKSQIGSLRSLEDLLLPDPLSGSAETGGNTSANAAVNATAGATALPLVNGVSTSYAPGSGPVGGSGDSGLVHRRTFGDSPTIPPEDVIVRSSGRSSADRDRDRPMVNGDVPLGERKTDWSNGVDVRTVDAVRDDAGTGSSRFGTTGGTGTGEEIR